MIPSECLHLGLVLIGYARSVCICVHDCVLCRDELYNITLCVCLSLRFLQPVSPPFRPVPMNINDNNRLGCGLIEMNGGLRGRSVGRSYVQSVDV